SLPAPDQCIWRVSPLFTAYRTSSTRLDTPSFSNIRNRYFLIVCSLRFNSRAIWRLPIPSETSPTTCSSRGASRKWPPELTTRIDGVPENMSTSRLSCSEFGHTCLALTLHSQLHTTRRSESAV